MESGQQMMNGTQDACLKFQVDFLFLFLYTYFTNDTTTSYVNDDEQLTQAPCHITPTPDMQLQTVAATE